MICSTEIIWCSCLLLKSIHFIYKYIVLSHGSPWHWRPLCVQKTFVPVFPSILHICYFSSNLTWKQLPSSLILNFPAKLGRPSTCVHQMGKGEGERNLQTYGTYMVLIHARQYCLIYLQALVGPVWILHDFQGRSLFRRNQVAWNWIAYSQVVGNWTVWNWVA